MENIPTLKTKDVAEMLGLKQRTIEKYAREGRIKSYRFGWLYRFRQEDINTFIDSLESKS